MNILITLLTVLDVLVALLIIALVLVQQSKSGGLGTTFGGGGSDSLFGAHAGTHLSRLTVLFASLFLVITLSLAIITGHRPKNKSLAEMDAVLMSAPAEQEAAVDAMNAKEEGDSSAEQVAPEEDVDK